MAEDFGSGLERIHQWLYELGPVWHRLFLLWLGSSIAVALAFGTGALSLGPKWFWLVDAALLAIFAVSHIAYGRRSR